MFDTKHSKHDSRVDGAPVRDHVLELVAAGYPPTLIARMAGLQSRRVKLLLAHQPEHRGRYKHWIARHVAEPLLAIPVPDGMFVAATGPVRRLQALVRIGYSFDYLASITGYDEDLLAELSLGTPTVVDAELAVQLNECFDRHHLTPGTSVAARELGRRHRFAAPLAWAIDEDDDAGSIDDPNATPVGLTAADPRALTPDFVDIVADHRELGHYDEEIAEALGITRDALAKRLTRAGISQRARGDGRNIRKPLYGKRYEPRLACPGVAS